MSELTLTALQSNEATMKRHNMPSRIDEAPADDWPGDAPPVDKEAWRRAYDARLDTIMSDTDYVWDLFTNDMISESQQNWHTRQRMFCRDISYPLVDAMHGKNRDAEIGERIRERCVPVLDAECREWADEHWEDYV